VLELSKEHFGMNKRDIKQKSLKLKLLKSFTVKPFYAHIGEHVIELNQVLRPI